MTDKMSAVTDETTEKNATEQVTGQPAGRRPSRLEERRAIRAASPARAAVSELAASGALDGLFGRIDAGEIELTGDGGFVNELLKATLERGLAVELTDQQALAQLAIAYPDRINPHL